MASHITLRHYRRYPRRSRTPRALRWFAAVVLLLLLLLPLFAGCASSVSEAEGGISRTHSARYLSPCVWRNMREIGFGNKITNWVWNNWHENRKHSLINERSQHFLFLFCLFVYMPGDTLRGRLRKRPVFSRLRSRFRFAHIVDRAFWEPFQEA